MSPVGFAKKQKRVAPKEKEEMTKIKRGRGRPRKQEVILEVVKKEPEVKEDEKKSQELEAAKPSETEERKDLATKKKRRKRRKKRKKAAPKEKIASKEKEVAVDEEDVKVEEEKEPIEPAEEEKETVDSEADIESNSIEIEESGEIESEEETGDAGETEASGESGDAQRGEKGRGCVEQGDVTSIHSPRVFTTLKTQKRPTHNQLHQHLRVVEPELRKYLRQGLMDDMESLSFTFHLKKRRRK